MGLRKWRKMNRPYLTPIYTAKRLNWALTYRSALKSKFWSLNDSLKREAVEACFLGALRKTGLIPLYGDPNVERKGIIKEVIYTLYRSILPILLANKDAIFQYDNTPIHTAYIIQELLREMNYVWENLTVHYFVNLAETMPHRVEEVIKYEGWHTSY
ncbi:hypothetical protein N7491_005132 [Penicillium cf. griseofulvum]|uniref:Tc1-like transposase DDE domain-containing protein n=1 Tax=Penicillium cf. griseofulvum TaxID=2972120 RepID=A0A9W9J402_9EURO|nr:hypothetical protein N7472_007825 [Penicillium cf. griseofulvum]KAJ5434537.1 hypothetical protein N7491_005132 [Penicillium cf. griseofulvum]